MFTACTSSSVTRGAEGTLDTAYADSNLLIHEQVATNPLASFKSSSPTMQGALLGGATGAIAGGSFGGGGALPGGVGGLIVGGVIGGFLGKHATHADNIENLGGKVFVLGDQVKIVLPSNQIFQGYTASFGSQGYVMLNAVAKLVNGTIPMSVKVSAFGDGIGNHHVDQSLTEAQANQIVKYLWTKTHIRLISASGRGDHHPIAVLGSGANYRVEINLEKYTD